MDDVSNYAEWEDVDDSSPGAEDTDRANTMTGTTARREQSEDDDLAEALAASTLHLSVADLASISEASPPAANNHVGAESASSSSRSNTGLRFGAIGDYAANPPSLVQGHDFPSSAPGSWSQGADVETQHEQTTPRASMSLNGIMPTHTEEMTTDGPLTPRNDAGPFVFDGSAGRM